VKYKIKNYEVEIIGTHGYVEGLETGHVYDFSIYSNGKIGWGNRTPPKYVIESILSKFRKAKK
jgi:hypothetical protein